MNFNSLLYIAFLAGNVLIYYLLPQRLRNLQLLLASYFFYACWNVRYTLLLLLSTAVTYAGALMTERALFGRRRLWVALGFGVNLAILFFFKYFNFLSSLAAGLLAAAGLEISAPVLNVLLPVGISFYTFQALGYTVDVYRGDVPAEKNFIHYALFVSFFPQLVAGPIERSGRMLSQIKKPHLFRWENIRFGVLAVLWGLFKKVVLADNLAAVVNAVYAAPRAHTGLELLVATAAFAMQIYCDFSGYCHIARGSARMLGFELMENFRCPYLAESIPDFWRRWHISLSTWFRDYLYFPLGGSRCSLGRQVLNLLVVFAVSGLWHGAALTFLAWGLLHGLYQVLSVLTKPLRSCLAELFHIREGNVPVRVFRVIWTFFLVCMAWVLFRAETLSDALWIFRQIFSIPIHGLSGGLAGLEVSASAAGLLAAFIPALFVLDWLQCSRALPEKILRRPAARYGAYFALIVCILLFGSYGVGYNPQDFVYFQF